MQIKVQCTVEPTKSKKWLRLNPGDGAPIGPVVIKADQVNGSSKKPTITIDL